MLKCLRYGNNMKIAYIDGSRFYHAFVAGGNAVIAQQSYLNKINVFPVADADTGTNLATTINAIVQNSYHKKSIKDTIVSLADSALTGARGNSGIIFAQFLYSLSKELPKRAIITTREFAESAVKAIPALYQSLVNPLEGTMITVIRHWAHAMQKQSNDTSDFEQVFKYALEEANLTLEDTPNRLQVLANAGVVDAGAKGFVSFLEGVAHFISHGSLKNRNLSRPIPDFTTVHSTKSNLEIHQRFCCEIILSGSSSPIHELREELDKLGDSLILAGDDSKIHIHLHTDTPDIFLNICQKAGSCSNLKVDDMKLQQDISQNRKYDIGLITDTAGDLPQEILDKYQIQRISFGINIGHEFYLDKKTISTQQFYYKLKHSKHHPVSSQPSPRRVEDYMEFLASNYQNSISVHISSKLSGLYNVASIAASNHSKSNIKVLDSKQLSVSQGLLVLKIAREIEAGTSYNDIIRESETWIKNTKILTDVNTLKYMVRGGRVSPLKGTIAKLLNLKPIVSLDETGSGIAYGKSFSRKANMNKIIKTIADTHKNNNIYSYAIVHAEEEKRALEYASKLTKIIGIEPEYIMSLSPVIGVHNGPGTIAIGFMKEK